MGVGGISEMSMGEAESLGVVVARWRMGLMALLAADRLDIDAEKKLLLTHCFGWLDGGRWRRSFAERGPGWSAGQGAEPV